MKHIAVAALLLLSTAPLAHAAEITDDTPARAITIGKPEGDLNRVVFAEGVISMKECREALPANAEALKDQVVAIFCVPADLTDGERPKGDLPFLDLTE